MAGQRDSRFGVVWEEVRKGTLYQAEQGFPSRTEMGLEVTRIIQRPNFTRFVLIWSPEGETVIGEEGTEEVGDAIAGAETD